MIYADFAQQLDSYAQTGVMLSGTFWLTCCLMRVRHEADLDRLPIWDLKVNGEWDREERALTPEQKETVCRFLMECDALSDLAHVFERRVWFDAGLFDFIRAEKKYSTHGGSVHGIDMLSMCTCGRWMATIRKGAETDPNRCEITLIADESRPDILNKPVWDAYEYNRLTYWENMQPRLHNLGIQGFYGKRVDISAILERVITDWRAFDLQPGRAAFVA